MRQIIEVTDLSVLAAIQSMHKAEVHVHLDGSVPAEDVLRISGEQGIEVLLGEKDPFYNPLSARSREEKLITTPDQLREFWAGWDKYSIEDLFSPATNLMQIRDGIIALARAHVMDLANQNITYAETRFAPQYSTREYKKHHNKPPKRAGDIRVKTIEQAVEYMVEGLNLGMQDAKKAGKDITVKLILSIGREEPAEVGIEVARAALKYQTQGVVALDIACYEPRDPPEKFRAAYELTFDSRLKRTVHAGEMMGNDEDNLRNIYTALTLLRADGIGHGIPIWRRTYNGKDMVQLMIDRGVRLESNPVSNLFLRLINDIRYLHIDELVKAGVLVTVNSDDPTMWPNGSLAHNLYAVQKLYGEGIVRAVKQNAILSAFGLTPEEKAIMARRVA